MAKLASTTIYGDLTVLGRIKGPHIGNVTGPQGPPGPPGPEGITGPPGLDLSHLVPSTQGLVTVGDKNKHYPIIMDNSGTILGRYFTQVQDGAGFTSDNSLGVGVSALLNNTGYYSNGFGSSALVYNTGSFSNGFGYQSLYYNTGDNSSGFGHSSLLYNKGSFSNGFGSSALQYNTGAYANGFGYQSLYNNTGIYASGFGYQSLYNNAGANNTAVGYRSNSTFIENVSGRKTCNASDVDTANNQITIASHGFGINGSTTVVKYTSTTGTRIGGLNVGATYLITVVDGNTIELNQHLTSQGIGTHTFTPSITYSNTTCLGANTVPNRSNQVVLGNASVDTVKMGGARRTPTSSTSEGVRGETCWDANYFYICVATNSWKRTPLGAW